ncbi:hypothetical protein FH609_016505 [Streptomyces sp. 3MP-14]|uniref:Secreted protein n=1 Tax=Streptomyces mimosae TaxID=2586635 RepID=A0A5N6ABP7_9ACTN|nr:MULTISPECIES: hypothetical protein [Streptomyces]KAB8165190.1 hypothetical protein FH607_013830 [Streptomyces mimosae]KAB8175822.1 hypothetical protein FH609_016505 [Streptomyces sp. 3MP-14]
MDLRDSKSRLILIVVALGAALVIAVASCSGGGDDDGEPAATPSGESEAPEDEPSEDDGAGGDEEDDQDGGEEPEVLAEVTGEEDITLTITSAERETGGFLTVEGTLRNGGGDSWSDIAWAGGERELAGNAFSMAGATLTAREEGKRYLILRDTEGRCLCTNFGLRLDAGDTVTWFAQFPEPDPETTEVDFQIGQMPPATVEIR